MDAMSTENAAKQSKASAESMRTENVAKQSKASADSMRTENAAKESTASADNMRTENAAKQSKASTDSVQTENAAKESKASVDSMQMENKAKQLKVSGVGGRNEKAAKQLKVSADSMQTENAAKQSKASADSCRKQIEISRKIFQRLLESGHPAAQHDGFAELLQAYFVRLPPRYAQDVNIDRAEDVLVHKRLLELAEVPENRPAFTVRAVHVLPVGLEDFERSSEFSVNASPKQEQSLIISRSASRQSIHPPPSFGSSPNLEALAFELTNSAPMDEDKNSHSDNVSQRPHKPMHEVTFSARDRPKLLSQLSLVLADVGLNIREAHVFCTVDDYSLDVFVVDGWPTEDTEELHQALQSAFSNLEKGFWGGNSPLSSPPPTTYMDAPDAENLKIHSEGCDDWELDFSQLKFLNKVASGSFGELSRGTYCGQEVAIKVLKPERLNENLHREFVQEVSIMRKVRHKNVVQFIGACTTPPNLCIVTEFMVGGSIYDYLHKQKGTFKLPTMIRVYIDVSKGMDFLHQNNIIHRDLKAANLLMDENEVVKVADFRVARVRAHSGKMTAETGTYRWMAPEVIDHQSYNHKADVFSFGIVMWELLTGKLPYDYLTPLQAAIGVVQKGLRPVIPKGTQPRLAELLQSCWQQDPAKRPEFKGITVILREIMKEVLEEEKKEKKSGGFFAALKRTNR